MKPEQKLSALLKPDFGTFFIVRVEEMIRLIKLPVPPTRSTTHTLIYLTDGEAVMTIGSETYTIYQDECLFVPAGQVFSFNQVDINQGYLCNFHNDFLIGKFGSQEMLLDFEYFRVWGNPRIPLDKQTSHYVLRLLQRLFHEYADNGIQNRDIVQAYFMALLYEINHVYEPLINSQQIQSTQAVALTNQFKELLFYNVRTKHLVADYAALLNITPNHLNRVVKRVTGKTPKKWIDETLIMEAKALLYQTDLSISEIAAAIGVFDPSYFSRLFKKVAGLTPSAFRNMIEMS